MICLKPFPGKENHGPLLDRTWKPKAKRGKALFAYTFWGRFVIAKAKRNLDGTRLFVDLTKDDIQKAKDWYKFWDFIDDAPQNQETEL